MSVPLTAAEKKHLSAIVEMATNQNIPSIKEDIQHGLHNSESLLEVQKEIVKFFPALPDSPKKLIVTGVYNPETFSALLDRLVEQGHYETVKRALWNNDRSVLDPNAREAPAAKPERGELTPPKVSTSSEASTPLPPSSRTSSSSSSTTTSQPSTSSPSRAQPGSEIIQEQIERRVPIREQAQPAEEKPEELDQEEQPEQPREPQQPRGAPKQPQAGSTPPPSSPPGGRGGPPSIPPPPGGDEGEERERKRRRLPRFLRPRPDGGGWWKAWNPRQLWRLAKNLGRLAGRGLQALARLGAQALQRLLPQLLSRLGLGALPGIASGIGGWLSGLAGIGSAIGAGIVVAAPIIAIYGVIIGILGAFYLYEQNVLMQSECDKAAGEMRMEKRLTNSLDANQPSLRNEDRQLNYLIEVHYDLSCRDKTIPLVEVTDKIPEGTVYDTQNPTAISSFLNNGAPGPNGVYDENTRTLTWTFRDFPLQNPARITFSLNRDENTNDTWISNAATVRFTNPGTPAAGAPGTSGGPTGGRVIDSSSATFQDVLVQAAQNQGMDPMLLKAILKVEAGNVLSYSEEEFRKFSTPGWWEGLQDSAPTIAQNHPDIVRGYGYNTCAYRNDCPRNDVRGVAQFELATWNGIAPQLNFLNHPPDRRNASDAIFGSAILNKRNAASYAGTPNFQWNEDIIKAMARMYCAGPAAGRNPSLARVSACGFTYDDLVWGYYQQFLAEQR